MSLTFKESPPKDINFRAVPTGEFLTADRKDDEARPQKCIVFRKPGYPDADPELISFDGIEMRVLNASAVPSLFKNIQGPFKFRTQFTGEVHA